MAARPSSNQVQVVIHTDDGSERTEMVPIGAPITIGRHVNCVLRLDSDLVSRQHAVVEIGPASMRVEDVSTNGTIAGEMLLRRQAVDVPFGTPVVLGNFTVYFMPPPGAAAAPVPRAPVAGQVIGQVPGQLPGQGLGQLPQIPGGHGRPPLAAVPAPGQATPPVAVPQGPAPAAADRPQQPRVLAQGAITTPEALQKREKQVALRREIHKLLLEHLDLAAMDPSKVDDPSMRPKVLNALRRIITNIESRLPPDTDRDQLIGELTDEALGLGPLERFLADPQITEIMVVDPNTIYIERSGKLTLSETRFTDDERVRAVIERIVTPLGRRIDESSPLVDARLKDGSRVNAVIKPLALRGSCITIRKFSKTPLTLEKLVGFGALTPQMGLFLTRSVIAKRNIVISGGTGSGKTTLLNVLSGAIPSEERIVTIEDAAELQLAQPHVVSLETRPANLEGKGEYTIRDLVKNSLRMRPDRIVVGECRGGEALDMLQAMNTGHDGSLTTTHANSPEEAISRIETLVLMAGVDLPVRAIRDQIAGAVHVIVQQTRFSDGSRRVSAISEVTGVGDEGTIEMRPIFEFIRTGTGPNGKVIGEFRATGYLPSYLNDFIVMGLVKRGEAYL
ncbi:Flp pilus assembly complex ATPase component TadA [Pendulispora rubella]|uniref:Flp pilus assembly complex ATPase component TadA n=1 Tax=Pendulispora rubella TaxID=2741070 RepID=A0ABZ2L8G0_9BACT